MLCLHGSPLNCIKGINSALNISPDLTTKRFDTMEQLSQQAATCTSSFPGTSGYKMMKLSAIALLASRHHCMHTTCC